jgi:hypothetical protein
MGKRTENGKWVRKFGMTNTQGTSDGRRPRSLSPSMWGAQPLLSQCYQILWFLRESKQAGYYVKSEKYMPQWSPVLLNNLRALPGNELSTLTNTCLWSSPFFLARWAPRVSPCVEHILFAGLFYHFVEQLRCLFPLLALSAPVNLWSGILWWWSVLQCTNVFRNSDIKIGLIMENYLYLGVTISSWQYSSSFCDENLLNSIGNFLL